jgi:hypothetical protein
MLLMAKRTRSIVFQVELFQDPIFVKSDSAGGYTQDRRDFFIMTLCRRLSTLRVLG